MKVLVTGACGYIGSHMALMLKQKNVSVVLLDGNIANQKTIPSNVHICHLQDKAKLRKIFTTHDIDIVLHFAGCIDTAESLTNPEKYYAENVEGTLCLLEIMREFNVSKIVFSSSAAVYGDVQETPILETAIKNPCSPYGRSKLHVEQILEDYTKAYSFKAVCLRYFNVAGCEVHSELFENHPTETHLIPLILSAVEDGKEITVFGVDYPTSDGSCIRDYIHVVDLCDAHYKCMLSFDKLDHFTAFNVGTGVGVSVKEVIHAVKKVLKKNVHVASKPRREGDPITLVADSTKIQNELHWKPLYSDIHKIISDAYVGHQRRIKDYYEK